MTLDTVPRETPASLATSFIVGAVFCFAMRATPLFVKRFYFKWIYIKGNLAVFLLTLRFLQLQYSMVFPECKGFFVKFHEPFHERAMMHFAQKHPAASVQNIENMDTRHFLRKNLLTQKRWRVIFVLQAV